jgi:hypothetical protein
LNASLLAWPTGHGLEEHANKERDVLLVVLEGAVWRESTESDMTSHAGTRC